MSVLSVICLASLRKAEIDSQEGVVPEDDEWIYEEYGPEEHGRGNNDSCQS